MFGSIVARFVLFSMLFRSYIAAYMPLKSRTSSIGRPLASIQTTAQSININNSTHFNLTVVTWNLAESTPQRKDCAFLEDLAAVDTEIMVVGVQECENVSVRREEGYRSANWRKMQRQLFSKQGFVLGAEDKCGGMQLSIYVKKHVLKQVKAVQLISVPCGIANIISNKGAISALIRFRNNKTLALVSCHLAAHVNKVQERHRDYQRIFDHIHEHARKSWKADEDEYFSHPRKLTPRLASFGHHLKSSFSGIEPLVRPADQTQRAVYGLSRQDEPSSKSWAFDSVVFFGDLNYRINCPQHEMMSLILDQQDTSENMNVPATALNMSYYSKHDQCSLAIKEGRILKGFLEQEKKFPPTYKYDPGSACYDTSEKMRLPAWTDRVFYSVYNHSVGARSGVQRQGNYRKVKGLHTTRLVKSRKYKKFPVSVLTNSTAEGRLVAEGSDQHTPTHTADPCPPALPPAEPMLDPVPGTYTSYPHVLHGDHRPVSCRFKLIV